MMRRMNRKSVTSATIADKKSSAGYQVFREIMRDLYEGRYVPGQRLVETDLAKDHQVSRFVIKGALKFLAAEGVVDDAFHRSCRIPRLTREEAAQILRVMEWFFALAAREATVAVTRNGMDSSLRDALTEVSQHASNQDFFEFGRACSRFFRTIAKLSCNSELLRLMTLLRVHIVRVQFKPYPTAAEYTRVREFEAITNTILSGLPDEAETVTRKYFQRLSSDIISLPGRAFSTE
jgi:DNA-binding GntR family transcriptional regulator